MPFCTFLVIGWLNFITCAFLGPITLMALHVMSPSLAMAICAKVQTYYSHGGEQAPTVVPTFTFLHEAAETLIQSSMGYL